VRRLSRTTFAQFLERLDVVVFASLCATISRENRAWCANSMPQLKKNATLLLIFMLMRDCIHVMAATNANAKRRAEP
jgi:hypothetical protein